jgi:hypothetical protein
MQYAQIKFVEPDARKIGIAASAPLPHITRNGLSGGGVIRVARKNNIPVCNLSYKTDVK